MPFLSSLAFFVPSLKRSFDSAGIDRTFPEMEL